MWLWKPQFDTKWKVISVSIRKKLNQVRRNGLRGSLVELGLRLLQLLLHFSRWCIYAFVLGIVMLESLWSDDSVIWWRTQ